MNVVHAIVMAADGGARSWVWAVVAGLVLGSVLIVHAARQIGRSFPPEVRSAASDAVRRRPRMIVVTAVAAGWTIVYALYSLANPATSVLSGAAPAAPRPIASAPLSLPPAVGASSGVSDVISDIADSGGFDVLGFETPSTSDEADTGSPSPESALPPTVPAPPPVACSVEAQAEAVRGAQLLAEGLIGQPLGADGGAVVEALAGCKDPTNTALSLLGPIDVILRLAGINDALPLPSAPYVAPVPIPEAIAAPLRPQVFDVCGQLIRQLYTVALVGPVVRLDYQDIVSVIGIVSSVCQSFAPQKP